MNSSTRWRCNSDRPVTLRTIRHVHFGARPDRPTLIGLTDMFAERCEPYGIEVDRAAALIGNRNSFSEMAGHMLATLCASRTPEVIALAHGVPDCDPSVSIGGYLQHRFGGQPLTFAVSDLGRVAGFAALRLALDQLGARADSHALMIALDQGTLVYPDDAWVDLDRTTDHAVGLLLDRTPDRDCAPDSATATVLGVRQAPATSPDDVARHVAEAVDELGATGPVSLVAGSGLQPRTDLPSHRGATATAPRDRTCTAVWTALAQELNQPHPYPRTVLVAEYEPTLTHLSLAAFAVPATSPPEGAR